MWLWLLFSLVWLTSVRQISYLLSKAVCLFVCKDRPAFQKQTKQSFISLLFFFLSFFLFLEWVFLLLLQEAFCLSATAQFTRLDAVTFRWLVVKTPCNPCCLWNLSTGHASFPTSLQWSQWAEQFPCARRVGIIYLHDECDTIHSAVIHSLLYVKNTNVCFM